MEGSEAVNARVRRLPPVDKLVEASGIDVELPRWSLLAGARGVLAEARSAILAGREDVSVELEELARLSRARAARLSQPWPVRVINATGIVLHTNLGRAPLAEDAAREVARAASGYSDLELDLSSGQRGSRTERVAELLCLIAGAEAAHVVNNNAAALLLAVEAIAAEREVVLSRGEMVEIGGSFRVPEIMEASHASLREIGTTNRTHLRDYERAINDRTGMLLKVHRSNFRIEGFTADVKLTELAELGARCSVPVVEDRGSGSFVDLREHGVPESEAWEGLRAGADLVLFSGDKLLGGPQAGILLGRAELIERVRRHPMARAMRVDKMTLAALHWTLRTLLDDRAEQIPVIGKLLEPPAALAARAHRLAAALVAVGWSEATVEELSSSVGGGALPEIQLPSWVVRIPSRSQESGKGRNANELSRLLRTGSPAILVRVHRDAIQLDCRTLCDAEIEAISMAFGKLFVDRSARSG
ncbi:MAG: L-seryl-tRNA(Sec) selenium transferase [bacterium]|nr:L-seryl-tRNA(Sec) selenium transferase [bacterium]